MRQRQKCCYDHWEATNRTLRRRADRQCACRGECGCRNKSQVFDESTLERQS